jgi:exodeoxyribonuclease VII large subunit
MSETYSLMSEKADSIRLSQLARQVKQSLSASMPGIYKIVAEINEIKENASGHCYLELIDKEEGTDTILARTNANIWAYSWRMIKPYFETTTGQRLDKGMKVLVAVTVEYHEVYGLSLNIKDIDPAYTLGEMALARLQVIQRLKKEGIFDMNQSMEMPLVPQRIALISSPTAAGYGDFMKHITDNEFEYSFHIQLFASLMQGSEAVSSIVSALNEINENFENFDVVVILRGGGSRTDLACFDDYRLASHVAQFPLPVITGIGHEQDDSVTDMVAHTRLKTPTAVAAFLIDALNEVENMTLDWYDAMTEKVQSILNTEKEKLTRLSLTFPSLVTGVINQNRNFLERLSIQLSEASRKATRVASLAVDKTERKLETASLLSIKNQQTKLNTLTTKLQHNIKQSIREHEHRLSQHSLLADTYDPKHVLARGYSLSLIDGKLVSSVKMLEVGQTITTRLSDGSYSSKVESIYQKGQ